MNDNLNEKLAASFKQWWESKHDWDFTGEGFYEKRFHEAFCAGYNADCQRDNWKEAYRSVSNDLNLVVTDNDRLKAKLARAVESLREIDMTLSDHEYSETGYTRHHISAVLAELEGMK